MWECEPVIFGNISLQQLKVMLTLDNVTIPQIDFGRSWDLWVIRDFKGGARSIDTDFPKWGLGACGSQDFWDLRDSKG